MLRKFIKVFAGPMKRLGKMDLKYDMKIDVNISEVRSQQPYHTPPHHSAALNVRESLH